MGPVAHRASLCNPLGLSGRCPCRCGTLGAMECHLRSCREKYQPMVQCPFNDFFFFLHFYRLGYIVPLFIERLSVVSGSLLVVGWIVLFLNFFFLTIASCLTLDKFSNLFICETGIIMESIL